MKVIRGAGSLPAFRHPVVTVGSFDGVHRGHKLLLDTTVRKAAETASESVAVTFDPHPRAVLKPGGKTWLLSTTEEKLLLLASAGIDCTVVIDFDEEFSRMAPSDFIGSVITGSLHASAMVVGYDHRFGRNKEGDHRFLKGVNEEVEIIRVPEFTSDGLKISSTAARDAVGKGDMVEACAILGHRYFAVAAVTGCVVTLPDPDKLMPPAGVYEVSIAELPQTSGSVRYLLGEGESNLLRISPEGRRELDSPVDWAAGRRVVISFFL